MALHDGQILLSNGSSFPNPAKLTGDIPIFGDQEHTARFAIEPVDEVRLSVVTQVEAEAANHTGIDVALRWMTDQASRLIDCQQRLVLEEDVNRFFHIG